MPPLRPAPAFSNAPEPNPSTRGEIAARDVRDLALAVVEGAVAAEALAKELKRTPDRSKHFADIAERLRAVVNRTSIRRALAEEAANIAVSRPPATTRPSPLEPQKTPTEEARPSGDRSIPIDPTELARAVTAQLPFTEIARTVAAILTPTLEDVTTRLARMEHRSEAQKTTVVERAIVATPADAIGLAARLADRVAKEGPIAVAIERR